MPDLKGACTAVIENQVALINSYGVCMFHWLLDPLGYAPESYYGKAYGRGDRHRPDQGKS